MIPDFFFIKSMEDHITLDLLAKFPALSPALFKKDITVRITGERIVQGRNYIMLENNEGIGIEFPNELIKVNGLQILPDSRLELTAALYDHWFNEKRQHQWEFWSQKLHTHFDQVWEKRDLIISKPEYFLLRTHWLYSGSLYYTGYYSLSFRCVT